MARNHVVQSEGVGGAAGNTPYTFSGLYTCCSSILATTECDAYDPATDTWTSLASIPQAVTHCGQVADMDDSSNQVFWLVGGFLGDHPGPTTDQVWKFSINFNTWDAGSSLLDSSAAGALLLF